MVKNVKKSVVYVPFKCPIIPQRMDTVPVIVPMMLSLVVKFATGKLGLVVLLKWIFRPVCKVLGL